MGLQTTCKRLTGHTLFKLAYGQEVVMPMEYVVPSLKIVALTEMTDVEIVNQRLLHLLGLEEDRFIARFNQQV